MGTRPRRCQPTFCSKRVRLGITLVMLSYVCAEMIYANCALIGPLEQKFSCLSHWVSRSAALVAPSVLFNGEALRELENVAVHKFEAQS